MNFSIVFAPRTKAAAFQRLHKKFKILRFVIDIHRRAGYILSRRTWASYLENTIENLETSTDHCRICPWKQSFDVATS